MPEKKSSHILHFAIAITILCGPCSDRSSNMWLFGECHCCGSWQLAKVNFNSNPVDLTYFVGLLAIEIQICNVSVRVVKVEIGILPQKIL